MTRRSSSLTERASSWRPEWFVVARFTAVGCLLGAAVIHASQVRTHFSEWRTAGYVFVLIAALEALLAFALALTLSHRVVQVAVGLSAGTVFLWTISRTVGIPWGPHSGVPEPITRTDLISKGLEVLTVAALILTLARPRKGTSSPRATYIAVGVIATAILLLTGAAVQPFGGCEQRGEHAASIGPLAPVDGHSLLPRDTPMAKAPAGREGGLVVGLLRNCSDRPVGVRGARIISETNFDRAVATGTFWVVPPPIARSGALLTVSEVTTLGSPLPGDIAIFPVSASNEMPGLVLLLTTLRPGQYSVDGIEVSYSVGGESYVAPFADIARVVVLANAEGG